MTTEEALKKYFGYETFRPLQKEIITHVMQGGSGLVLMPTGGGKSLCYQFPALQRPGLTVVISPLIALMKDQVDALTENGIPAAFWNSSLKPSEAMDVQRRAKQGSIRLLYLSPERLAMPETQRLLQESNVQFIAIDEAHCISEWGHDFRPDYRNLRVLRQLFPKIPVLALTATANPRVKADILHQLHLEQSRVFQSSFNRENLRYRVIPKKKSFDRLLAELQSRPGQSAIVYSFSRNGTEKIAKDLQAHGIMAAAYHAGLSATERTRVQDRFIRDQVPVVVATIAFGMGIDKPDVRLVVHMDLPKSVEGYYQETGRAGRDGLPSDCVLFYSIGDRIKHEYFIRMMDDLDERNRTRQQLAEMIRYGELKTCRRAYLLQYFGETSSERTCPACDNCQTIPLPSVSIASTKKKSSGGVFDQELFELLRTKRRELADARSIPPYLIFGDRTLQEMAQQFPQRMESMSRVFGVGREKLEKYGDPFLAIVTEYAKQRQIPERMTSEPSVERVQKVKSLSTTALESYRQLKEGKTPSQIANIRRLAVGTILQHLEEVRKAGKPLDVSHVQVPNERYDRIVAQFQSSSEPFLAPIKAKLGDDYSYDEIRLVRLLWMCRR